MAEDGAGPPAGGTVVLSLDAELNWGFHSKRTVPTARVEHARESWLDLLALFDEHRIPATWAVVGHLFLDRCTGTHPDHPGGEEWFAGDPGGEYEPGSGWFGPDLIDAIRDSDVDHDIGSHTFSHVEFGSPETTREVAEAELRHSVAAAEDYGVDLESFVFPRNHIGHLDLLSDHGFTSYRGRSPDRWHDTAPLRRFAKVATFAFGLSSPPIVEPTIDERGLVNVPASMYLFEFEGPVRDAITAVSEDPIVRQVGAGLDRIADEEGGILHLWLHPNNVTTDRDRARMNAVVATIVEYRDRGDVAIETMSGVADRVRNEEGRRRAADRP